MMGSALFVVCLSLLPVLLRAQDVVTCSGKIKSDFKIDFSKINIQLYTKSGSLSETSDCAPNNGYFVVPVYDRGDYVIKVAPPIGWGFEPNEVTISFDGETDPCSLNQDIFFHFTGFTISGQVANVDQVNGPQGVRIKIEGPGLLREIETLVDGFFLLPNILPGQYSVTGSHLVWNISEDPVSVTVSTDNVELPVNSIQVEGYDVKGFIKSKGEPVAEVLFLLYPQNGIKDRIKIKCQSVETPPTISGTTPPSCIAKSSAEGTFVFQSLPSGKYRIVPHYQSAESKFQVSPSEAEFSVMNDSVVIEPVFEVQGFSVFGKVLQKPRGGGLRGAKVVVDGQLETTTDANGHYQLQNVTAGTYKIEVSAPDVEFDSLEVFLTPSSSKLPDLFPSRYSICGKVKIVFQPLEAFMAGSRSVSVELESDPGRNVDSTTTDDTGLFCFMLAPEKYAIMVTVSADESQRGLVLLPQRLSVTVEHMPISHQQLSFKQFTGTLSANINCLWVCFKDEVSLERLFDNKKVVKAVVALGPSLTGVSFTSLLPGEYKVSVVPTLQTSFCWSQITQTVEVPTSGTHPPVNFTQLGYKMEIQSTHNTNVKMFRDNDFSTSRMMKIHKGKNEICLDDPGDYSVLPESCYNFQGDMYMFMTTMPVALELKAFSHKVSASVIAPEGSSVTINVQFSNTKKPKKDKTLKPLSNPTVPDANGLYTYQYSFDGRPKTIAALTPYSKDLLCSPTSLSFTVGKVCPESVPAFHCSKGLFVEGSVDPPLEGVVITVSLSNGQQIDTMTNGSGQYTVGPLPTAVSHTVEPRMDQYIFHLASEDNPYAFKAIKMSQITIKVVDISGGALSGTLISISGEDFRSTDTATGEGTVTHQNMAPGEYYVKPILREFEFSPTSQVAEVKQGEDLMVSFTGKRVAFSVSGKVMSLNRAPLQGVTVQVTGQGEKCYSFQESSLSDETGLYKFRGIMPSCSYVLAVVTGDNSLVEKGIPQEKYLQISEDISDENFVTIVKPSQLVMTGNVVTPTPEHLNTLKVVVYPDKFLDSSLYSTSPDSVGFFDIPLRLGAPTTLYVRAETSLSSHYYRIISNTTSFSTADFDDHITIFFSAEPVSATAESSSSRGSFIGILLAVGTVFFLFNTAKIYRLIPPIMAMGALKRLSLMKKSRRR